MEIKNFETIEIISRDIVPLFKENNGISFLRYKWSVCKISDE